MSTNLNGSMSASHRTSRWTRLKHHVAEWRRRVHSRHELMRLGNESLHDIGMSRCDAAGEASKPFWLA